MRQKTPSGERTNKTVWRRDPGTELRGAIRRWEKQLPAVTRESDPWGADGVVDYHAWAREFLAARGLPAAQDKVPPRKETLVLHGRKFQTQEGNTRADQLLRVEERFERESAEAWAARIERAHLTGAHQGQTETVRLFEHLAAWAAGVQEERTEAPKRAGKADRGFAGLALPRLLERAYEHKPAWRTEHQADLARYVQKIGRADRENLIAAGQKPKYEIPPNDRDIARQIRRLIKKTRTERA